MSAVPQLTIAGDNDLASELGRHAISANLANPVYLWRDLRDPVAEGTPVFVVADSQQRAEFTRVAVDTGSTVVSLPIPDPNDSLVAAIETGQLRQISGLHGVPVLARLQRDCQAGSDGRRYGIFAAHRLPRNHADLVPAALSDLLVFVASLGSSGLKSVRATTRSFGNGDIDAWFILARFLDDVIATIEVSAVLPSAWEPNGHLLIEVTGSEAVLRAEPERQAVEIVTPAGVERNPWYDEPAGPLLGTALAAFEANDPRRQMAALNLTRHLDSAAGSDSVFQIG